MVGDLVGVLAHLVDAPLHLFRGPGQHVADQLLLVEPGQGGIIAAVTACVTAGQLTWTGRGSAGWGRGAGATPGRARTARTRWARGHPQTPGTPRSVRGYDIY